MSYNKTQSDRPQISSASACLLIVRHQHTRTPLMRSLDRFYSPRSPRTWTPQTSWIPRCPGSFGGLFGPCSGQGSRRKTVLWKSRKQKTRQWVSSLLERKSRFGPSANSCSRPSESIGSCCGWPARQCGSGRFPEGVWSAHKTQTQELQRDPEVVLAAIRGPKGHWDAISAGSPEVRGFGAHENRYVGALLQVRQADKRSGSTSKYHEQPRKRVAGLFMTSRRTSFRHQCLPCKGQDPTTLGIGIVVAYRRAYTDCMLGRSSLRICCFNLPALGVVLVLRGTQGRKLVLLWLHFLIAVKH